MKKLMTSVLVLFCLIAFTGCATVFKGINSEIKCTSLPNCDIFIDGIHAGKTPLKVKLSAKKSYIIEFRREGYHTYTRRITNKVSATWVVIDVLFGLWPVLIDAVTGAWQQLDTKEVYVNLQKLN